MIDMGDPAQCAADLAIADLRLVAMSEGCPCPMCKALDMKHDVDVLASRHGRPVLVQWRYQPKWHYNTVTVRLSSDRGDPNVQGAKILSGRSLADIHVQGYACHIVTIGKTDLLAAVRHPRLMRCDQHKGDQQGWGGQVFTPFCPHCSDAILIQRPGIPCSYVRPSHWDFRRNTA